MGKFILAGVLALALMPSAIAGALGGNYTVQKIESGYEAQLTRIQNTFHSNCAEGAYAEQVNDLSGRRRAALRAYNIFPNDYSTCGDGEGYGG
ncbi:MAG: hypothetical protein FD180_2193 [Planctomycetota bacterium]|nr:MAG: hypothetical protein FD180_2193 [Planctomycetota bacterium]